MYFQGDSSTNADFVEVFSERGHYVGSTSCPEDVALFARAARAFGEVLRATGEHRRSGFGFDYRFAPREDSRTRTARFPTREEALQRLEWFERAGYTCGEVRAL